MLASAVVVLDRPFFQGLTLHGASHDSLKKALAIEGRFFLLAYIAAQLLNEPARRGSHKIPPFYSTFRLDE